MATRSQHVRICSTDNARYALFERDAPIVEANDFLHAIELRGLSAMTVRSYAYDLVLLYRWLRESGKSLERLIKSDLLQLIEVQRRAQASPRSINHRLTTLHLLYRFHFGSDLPGSKISLPGPYYKGPGRDHALGLHRLAPRPTRQLRVKEPRRLVEPLTPDQVSTFFRRLVRYRDLAIVHLMLFCGFRTCEVIRIELHDVDFAEHQIRVRGKGGRERVLPMPRSLERVLRRYLAIERPTRCKVSRLLVVLQGARRGSALSAAGVRSLFRHRRQQALLAGANAHRFRHTFGTDMARAGVRLPVLQKLMGHADAKTTLQYIQLSMADIAEEYRRAVAVLEKRHRQR